MHVFGVQRAAARDQCEWTPSVEESISVNPCFSAVSQRPAPSRKFAANNVAGEHRWDAAKSSMAPERFPKPVRARWIFGCPRHRDREAITARATLTAGRAVGPKSWS